MDGQSLLSRSPEWERLRMLLAKARGRGLGSLDEQELWELPSLYRKALSDLSLLRSRGGHPQLQQALADLCNTAHGVIYQRVARSGGVGLGTYLFGELPRTFRRRSGLVILAALTMVLFAVLGWAHAALNPQLASRVLSPRLTNGIETSLKAARKEGELGLAAQIEPKERMAAWIGITLNNWGVSFRAFLFGIAGGLPSFLINAFNGYMLGAIAYIYFHTDPGIKINLPLYFIAGIAPHGSIELPAICLSVAAGMLLGLSWIFPGQRPRGEALREAATDAWRLALICGLTLAVAGLLEGFITPLNQPAGVPWELWAWGKIAIGVFVFTSWLCWLTLGDVGGKRLAVVSAQGATNAT